MKISDEILDRVRRIETKLSRFIAGEPDKATQLHCEAWRTPEGVEIDVNSMGVSLQTVIDAARSAGCGADEFVICDNGKARLVARNIN